MKHILLIPITSALLLCFSAHADLPVEKHYICDGHVVVYTVKDKPNISIRPNGQYAWDGASLWDANGNPHQGTIDTVCRKYQDKLKQGAKPGTELRSYAFIDN